MKLTWKIKLPLCSQAEGLTPALQAEMDVKEAIQLQQAENGEVVQIQMPVNAVNTWDVRTQTFSRTSGREYSAGPWRSLGRGEPTPEFSNENLAIG